MKRLIEKYDKEFIKDGERISCTGLDIDFSEVPDNCDFSDYEVDIINVLYDDCHIKVRIDFENNRINIKLPNVIKHLLYLAFQQGQDRCRELIQKSIYESDCIKKKVPIGYDNVL